ncbi:hypothetical protein [Micromonospora lupini]|uniref:Uncharacterized protein n=1 Tax=Micromonospora lupini str. Lupac 08 TaxID=1150864 RepID=I0L1N3_9ACTN|nr:hypothetical protein [Micromonospora lupini]CCH17730.1 hypothetical protein MILUP08_42661 [Micromonospora lupini str. Lupac 08]
MTEEFSEDNGRLGCTAVQAWREVTGEPMPDDLLTAFLAAASSNASEGPSVACEHHHSNGDDRLVCHVRLIEDLLEARARTDRARHEAAEHRAGLRRLQLGVRTAGLGTLGENPDFEGSLSEALADWGLPPVPSNHMVTLRVPITICVSAVDGVEAVRLAVSELSEESPRLPRRPLFCADEVEVVSITTE